jgi:hypothetical protein
LKKRRISLVLCLVMMLSAVIPMTTYADINTAEVEPTYIGIMPLWQNIVGINVIMSITNGRAEMAGTVVAGIGTTSISVNAILDRVDSNGNLLANIASWNNLTTNGNTWAWERPHMVARGHFYRLTLEVTAVRNGVSETVPVSRTVWAD